MQRRMKTKLIVTILVSIVMMACNRNDVYFQYANVNPIGWSKDSLYGFDVEITDTISHYNVYVNVRNNGTYPYQNLWVFLSRTTPEKVIERDSIEFYLTDKRGKWLGSGLGSVHHMPVLYQQNVSFHKAGIYHYSLVQGMRDTLLMGINDIGIRVEKLP
jgi:gliding motility-associated lipoprotein GldH